MGLEGGDKEVEGDEGVVVVDDFRVGDSEVVTCVVRDLNELTRGDKGAGGEGGRAIVGDFRVGDSEAVACEVVDWEGAVGDGGGSLSFR